MELILVRHPEVALPAGTCYGQLDVALAEPMAPPAAEVLACVQAGGLVQRLVSSPLQRAARLAEHLSEALGCPCQLDSRWRELHFGDWEGWAWSAIPRALSDAWLVDVEHRAPPGGETLNELRTRVWAAMDDCAEHAGDDPLPRCVVVAHAGPIRVALARARGTSSQAQLSHPLAFGGLTRLSARRTPAGWHWQEMPT
jgi:alpha-ribazole phosphatase